MFEKGLVYTPGDNEWTDCHRANNGAHDPLERLDKLRQMFFQGGQSLGQQPLTLTRQPTVHAQHAAYVENAMWVHEGVVFVSLHIVGSNNNFEARQPQAVQEFFNRDAANVAWIEHAFAQAKALQAKALVFAFQADVFESKSRWEDFPAHSGFRRSVGETLLPLSAQANVPVLVIHGDSHEFKFDQAFQWQKKPLPSVYRLVVPGAQDVRAVMVSVDTTRPSVFQVRLITPRR
jgi:pimeloyl-ACP methyl ester carboxylesterase